MSQPIDVAFVELHARGEDDAAREVKRAVDQMERDVDRASREMQTDLSTAFRDAARDVERSVEGISDAINSSATKSRRALITMGDNVIEIFEDVSDSIDTATSAIGGGGGAGGGGGGGGLLGGVTQLSNQFRALGAQAPPPVFLALAAATPAVIGLVGALADLSALALLLPGAIAVLATSVVTLTTAFSGVGEAVKALASGDLEKIEAAMKRLAPAAQSFAREINALREPFAQLRRDVQQSFFAPLTGDLTRLAREVLPVLRTGMRDVAASFGELGSAIFDLLSENDVLEDVGDVFESTARIVRSITPELVEFLGTLFGVIESSLPFIERAFDALGRGLQAASDFLGGSLKSGDFNDFLEDAFSTLKDLADLAVAAFGLFKALFGSADDEGRSFIQVLTEATVRFTEFINSAEGQEVLQRTLDALKALGVVLGVVVEGVILFIRYQNLLFNALKTIGAAAVIAGVAIGRFFAFLGGGIADVAGHVGEFFQDVGGFFADLGGKIVDGFNAVVGFFGQAIDFIESLPGRALAALQALPELLVGLIVGMFDRLTFAVGFGIGTIVSFFLQLPQRTVAAVVLTVTSLINLFTFLRDQSIATFLNMVDTVVGFLASLPERAFNAAVAIGQRIRELFNSTRDSAVNTTNSLVSTVVSFLAGLPRRAGEAISALPGRILGVLRGIVRSAYDLGRDIIGGVIDGIGDAIGGAVDAAKRAAHRIKQGFLDALNVGSPSRVMADEVGRPIVQGIGVGMESEEPRLRDTINRLTNRVATPVLAGGLATANAGAGQTIAFGPGAVQVVFEGVVPSEQEAARTGESVGRSIAQTLARQRARTAVRTI